MEDDAAPQRRSLEPLSRLLRAFGFGKAGRQSSTSFVGKAKAAIPLPCLEPMFLKATLFPPSECPVLRVVVLLPCGQVFLKTLLAIVGSLPLLENQTRVFPLSSSLIEVPSVNRSLPSVSHKSAGVKCTLYSSYRGVVLHAGI